MNKKLSDKDKRDWQEFLLNKEKVIDKDISFKRNKSQKLKKIDLHGFTLEDANKEINYFINKCSQEKVDKIIVITGKGLRSKNMLNPYVSNDLSILKNSVPEFIRSSKALMKKIKEIRDAEIKDGGSGAFYIYLKKNI